jgi:carbon-monoxide dehydrogenase large subunit
LRAKARCSRSGFAPGSTASRRALADALAPLGIGDIAMPATPERPWRAIRAARGGVTVAAGVGWPPSKKA